MVRRLISRFLACHHIAKRIIHPDVTYFEVMHSRKGEPRVYSHISHVLARRDLLWTKTTKKLHDPVGCWNHIRPAKRHHQLRCRMIKKMYLILTGCYKAQQLISCLPGTRDGQGKFDAYDVQLRGEKAGPLSMGVRLEMITCDLFALKNCTKIKKSPAGGMTGNELANQKREW